MMDYHEMVYYEARLKDHSFGKQQIKNIEMLYQEYLYNVKIAGRELYKKAGPFLILPSLPEVRRVFYLFSQLLEFLMV